MKVLVTGGAGFIGSHLIQVLLDRGDSVCCVDNLSTGSKANVALFENNTKYKFFYGDLEKLSSLDKLVSDSDVIFHMAASVGVKNILENPIYCIENNIFCTSQILGLATLYKKRVFTFSTSEVYGKSKKFPFTEEDDIVLGPVHKLRWAYAASKLVDDYLSRAYFIEKGTDVTIVRLFNTIGSRQLGQYGMVVPRFFKSAIEHSAISIHGTGFQSRCFTDVRDVVRALTSLIDCQKSFGELVNIGASNEITINDLANRIKNITGSFSEIRHIEYKEVYGENFEDMQRRVPSCQKLEDLIDFKFQYSLNDTLSWIHQDLSQHKTNPRIETSGVKDIAL